MSTEKRMNNEKVQLLRDEKGGIWVVITSRTKLKRGFRERVKKYKLKGAEKLGLADLKKWVHKNFVVKRKRRRVKKGQKTQVEKKPVRDSVITGMSNSDFAKQFEKKEQELQRQIDVKKAVGQLEEKLERKDRELQIQKDAKKIVGQLEGKISPENIERKLVEALPVYDRTYTSKEAEQLYDTVQKLLKDKEKELKEKERKIESQEVKLEETEEEIKKAKAELDHKHNVIKEKNEKTARDRTYFDFKRPELLAEAIRIFGADKYPTKGGIYYTKDELWDALWKREDSAPKKYYNEKLAELNKQAGLGKFRKAINDPEGIAKIGKEDEGLNTIEINDIMKGYVDRGYQGALPRDYLAGVRPGAAKIWSCVLNTDPSTKSGTHWVAIFCDANKSKSIEYFDSFADPCPEDIRKDLKEIIEHMHLDTMLKFKENMVKMQSVNSQNCGYYACRFLQERYAGIPFWRATDYHPEKVISKVKEGEKGIEKWKKEFGYL